MICNPLDSLEQKRDQANQIKQLFEPFATMINRDGLHTSPAQIIEEMGICDIESECMTSICLKKPSLIRKPTPFFHLLT